MYADSLWMFTKCTQLLRRLLTKCTQVTLTKCTQNRACSTGVMVDYFWGRGGEFLGVLRGAPAEGVMEEWAGLWSVGPLCNQGETSPL